MPKRKVTCNKNDVSGRFLMSYGGFTVLASLLEPIEFLKLQGLDKFAYRTSISRVQLRVRLQSPLIAFLYTHGRRTDTLFVQNQEKLQKRIQSFTLKDSTKLRNATPIVVGRTLFAI